LDIIAENREEIITLLREGTCPICGKKGCKAPLMHMAKKHGTDSKTIKERLNIAKRTGFASEETHELMSKSAVINELGEKQL
jgi:hypothetical protein